MNPSGPPSGTTKQVDIRMWGKTQLELLEKAVRNQSLDRYVGTGSGSLLFAAVFCCESETPALENVPLLTQLKLMKRFDEEVDLIEEIASRARSLPREKRIPVMERASRREKSSAKTEYRSIEECKTVHEAGTYLSFFKTLFFQSHQTKRDSQVKEILDLETSILTYWMIYDACLKLTEKSPTVVTGLNVLDRCIRALDLFGKRVIGVCKDMRAPKKSKKSWQSWIASFFMEQAEADAEQERASSPWKRLPTLELEATDSLSFDVEEVSDLRQPSEISEIAKRFHDLFSNIHDIGESLSSAVKTSNPQKFISKFCLDMLNAVHRAAVVTLEDKGKHLARSLNLGHHHCRPITQRAIIESAAALCRVMPASLTSRIYESVKMKAIDLQNWRKSSNLLPASIYTSADAFLEKCIPLFWDIVMQRRSLVLVADHTTFCPSQHERFFESDESSLISYFVWPCLVEEATRDVLAKGRVVTREMMEREDVVDLEKCILAAVLAKKEEELTHYSQKLERQAREIEISKAAAKAKDAEIDSIRDLAIVEEDYSKVMVASGSFPNDDELVPDALMRTCAAVSPSKWEELGIFLNIALTNLDEFRESTGSNFVRMFRVLESWKKASKSPTVRQILSKFELIGVCREAIRRKFKETSED